MPIRSVPDAFIPSLLSFYGKVRDVWKRSLHLRCEVIWRGSAEPLIFLTIFDTLRFTMAISKKYQHISFVPTAEIARYASEGLRLRRRFRRGGTSIGFSRARDLKNRRCLSPRTILRMYSFFARHEVDKRGMHFGNSVRPSNGLIAWLLWGGDPAKDWVTNVRRQMKDADANSTSLS